MKEISKKTKIIALLIAIVIIAGMIVTFTIGFNFELRYRDAKKIQLYLEKEFEIADIKEITDEALPNQEVMIQKVEVFEDTVSILAEDITEEQKTQIINKINEKYGKELTTESVEITSIPNTSKKDMVKPYIVPFAIATVLILVYMAIRYYQLGMFKTIGKTILTLVIAQAFLLSVLAITRIPMGRFTISLVLVVYVLSLLGLTAHAEKKLADKKEEKK